MSDSQNMHHVTVHKEKKPWYRRFWVWVGIIIVALMIGGALSGGTKQENASQPASNGQSSTPAAEWDMEAAYAKVENGMTKAEVEEATGKKSESCSESQSEYIGKTELCTYGNAFIDKGTITVTYSQDKVSSKSKHKF